MVLGFYKIIVQYSLNDNYRHLLVLGGRSKQLPGFEHTRKTILLLFFAYCENVDTHRCFKENILYIEEIVYTDDVALKFYTIYIMIITVRSRVYQT